MDFICGLLGLLACTLSVYADTTTQSPKISRDKLAEIMQLDIPEIKKRMEKIFHLIDENADGVISEEESRVWGIKLKEAMHKHQVNLEFTSIDKDKDGRISLEELEVTYTGGVDPAQADGQKAEVYKRFKAVDKDNDGYLTLEEVTKLMDPGSDETLMQIEIEEIMNVQDKDGDGVIGLEEFLTTEGGQLTAQEKEELVKEFATYDHNKDEKIDVDELRTIIKDPHAHEMMAVTEKFLADLGDNKTVSLDDFTTDKIEIFSVSMLTDNGELLRFPEDYDGLDLGYTGVNSKNAVDQDVDLDAEHEEL